MCKSNMLTGYMGHAVLERRFLGKGEVVSSILTGSTVKLGTSDKFHCNNRQETAGTYRETTVPNVENPWRE